MNLGINKLSNINQRIIAGLLGAALVISGVIFSAWTYFILFFTICLFVLTEFYTLLKKSGVKPHKGFGIFSGMIIYTLVFFIETGLLSFKFYYVILPLLFSFFLIELFQKHEKPFVNIAFAFLGNLYIAFPFALLHACAFSIQSTYHYEIILGLFFLVWANDIGGYFAGMLLGKTKLFLRVSPKKTWEGAIGGAIFALIIGVSLSLRYTNLSTLDWIIMSLIIIVIGSCGDLVESLLKRSLAIKDSGDIIPGHGGFLDRFDSLLLSAPFIAAYLKLIN